MVLTSWFPIGVESLFLLGPFQDIVVCAMSPLDCADLLLVIPYQKQCKDIYDASTHNLQVMVHHSYFSPALAPSLGFILD